MSAAGKPFVGLLPPKDQRPKAAFFGKASLQAILRDNFSITTWLCIGAAVQGSLFLAAGRVALVPAAAYLLYQMFVAYAMSVGWTRNTYMDDIIPKKFSAQVPNEHGQYSSKPAESDVVVFLIGTRCNHPLGLLAPGFREMGVYFPGMVKDLEAHADEFGFLGMTSWLNADDRTSKSEMMQVGYFRTTEGLHNFAHSEYHMKAWRWWLSHAKQYPHLAIWHETYHVPKGHWENIYVNSHASGINSTTYHYVDEATGKDMWASPVVDASKGVLKSSAGRMSRSKGDEHEKLGLSPIDISS